MHRVGNRILQYDEESVQMKIETIESMLRELEDKLLSGKEKLAELDATRRSLLDSLIEISGAIKICRRILSSEEIEDANNPNS